MACHGGALDYDLMTMTHYTLSDVGGRMPTAALSHFLANLPPDSATMRALYPQEAERVAWMRGDATGVLIARLIDEVRSLEWLYSDAHSKTRLARPRRIPTPWAIDTSERCVGRDAIALSDFDAWWDSRDEGV